MTAKTVNLRWLLETLQEESTSKYFIQFDHFKANHMASGIIALSKLGASPSRIDQFIKWYGPTIEPPDHPNHTGENPQASPLNDNELSSVFGKRINYYGILNHYEMKLQTFANIDLFVQSEFTKLSRGMGCAAIHGLIHLGYGYHVKSPKIISEGIAFLHHSYIPLLFDSTKQENNIFYFGKGDMTMVGVLQEIRSDKILRQKMLSAASQLAKSDWYSSPFQYRFAAMMQNGDQLLKYANAINMSFDWSKEEDDKFFIGMSDWLLHQALTLYILSERPNDFFLLHGVTSAWALRQIIPVLKHSDALDALRTFTCVLLAAYMIQDCPALTNQIDFSKTKTDQGTWRDLIGRALSCDYDEHVFKLVQICYDLWCENQNSDNAALYTEAAKSCINHKFAFLTYQMQGEIKE